MACALTSTRARNEHPFDARRDTLLSHDSSCRIASHRIASHRAPPTRRRRHRRTRTTDARRERNQTLYFSRARNPVKRRETHARTTRVYVRMTRMTRMTRFNDATDDHVDTSIATSNDTAMRSPDVRDDAWLQKSEFHSVVFIRHHLRFRHHHSSSFVQIHSFIIIIIGRESHASRHSSPRRSRRCRHRHRRLARRSWGNTH